MERRTFIKSIGTVGVAITVAGCAEAGRQGNGGAVEDHGNGTDNRTDDSTTGGQTAVGEGDG